MQVQELSHALALPPVTQVDKRVPKTLLTERGAVTTADKRRIKDGIERIQWLAALKPDNIGVAAYRDGAREYLEIAVVRLTLREDAKWPRLVELLHRAIPYPAAVLIEPPKASGAVHLSLAHKRASLGDKDKTVLDGDVLTVAAPTDGSAFNRPFAEALTLSRQPHTSMLALYQGWMDTLLALQAARQTGHFELLTRNERRTARAEALKTCERLDATIIRLRAAAQREKQMARQVALNLDIQQAQAERAAAMKHL